MIVCWTWLISWLINKCPLFWNFVNKSTSGEELFQMQIQKHFVGLIPLYSYNTKLSEVSLFPAFFQEHTCSSFWPCICCSCIVVHGSQLVYYTLIYKSIKNCCCHGLQLKRRREGCLPWIFTHHTTNVFFNKQLFCDNIPTLTNYCSSLLRYLTLRGRDDEGQVGTWVQSFFAKKWPEIF